MNYTLLSDFCTIYRIPKIQEKLNTLYPNFDQKIPYTWIKMARDTVYSKPLAGPVKYFDYRFDYTVISKKKIIFLEVEDWRYFVAKIGL